MNTLRLMVLCCSFESWGTKNGRHQSRLGKTRFGGVQSTGKFDLKEPYYRQLTSWQPSPQYQEYGATAQNGYH